MSVYTQLTKQEFASYCHKFGQSFFKAEPITQGIKNSNWFIYTKETPAPDFVLTLFEERTPPDVAKMVAILQALGGKLPVAVPQIGANGEAVQLYEGKAVTLLPVLLGAHPSEQLPVTPVMCHAMGAAQATLHLSLQALVPPEHYGVALYPWHLVMAREIKYMPKDEADLMRAIWQAAADLPADLPRGLCHLDLFADNTLWRKNGDQNADSSVLLSGLLDFTEVAIERFAFDVAITMNDFCTEWGSAADGESVRFDDDKAAAMIAGYDSVRPLTADEKAALPVLLAQAAVTFWLLRLNVIYYNREQGRAGEHVMVKNPDLMKRLASLHWGRCV